MHAGRALLRAPVSIGRARVNFFAWPDGLSRKAAASFTRSQKSDMSWQERERSVAGASLISIDNYIRSMARRCMWKYVPGGRHRCSLAERLTGLHLARGLKSIIMSRQCFGSSS